MRVLLGNKLLVIRPDCDTVFEMKYYGVATRDSFIGIERATAVGVAQVASPSLGFAPIDIADLLGLEAR